MSEFDESKDKEVSDIIAYYEESKDIAPDTKSSDAKSAPDTEDTQVFKAVEQTESNTENTDDTENEQKQEPVLLNELIPKKRLPMTAWAGICAVLVVLSMFCIGRFVLPVSDLRIMGHKARLEETDKAYLHAKTENAKLSADISELEKNNEDIETTFNDVVEYKKTYDALSAEYKEQSDKSDSLDKEIKSLNSQLEALNDDLLKYYEKTYVLGAGVYTVGVHIPVGKYNAAGMGTILIASKNRALKENERLNMEGTVFDLDDEDTVKLDNEVRFIRVGD